MKHFFQFIICYTVLFGCTNDSMTTKEELLFEKNNSATESIFAAWNFSINFPNRLSIQIDSTSVLDEVTIRSDYNKGYCWIRCFEDKYNYYHSDSLDLIEFNLDYSQRAFSQTNYVTLVHTLPKSIQGYPGREYQFGYDNNDDITKRRVFMIHNRVYEIGYRGTGTAVFNADLTAFFDSFTLVDVPQNAIPYLNLPTDEELASPPFYANFFGVTQKNVEAEETYSGDKAIAVTEANEIASKNGVIELVLSVSYIVLPPNEEDLGFDFYLENSLNSFRQLDPNFVILSEEKKSNSASYRTTRILAEEKYFHNIRYLYQDRIFYVISSISPYNAPEDYRNKAFFDSFRVL